ncbi:hypothetical protein DW057_13345 [Lachnospira eligens]|nr:hypothetical protein DW057_13345 [Lachnospira eligens]
MRCHNNLSILLIRLLLLFSNRIFFISFSSFLNVRLLKTYQISAFHLFRMSFPPHILVFSVKSKFVCKFIFQLCGFIYATFIFKRFD